MFIWSQRDNNIYSINVSLFFHSHSQQQMFLLQMASIHMEREVGILLLFSLYEDQQLHPIQVSLISFIHGVYKSQKSNIILLDTVKSRVTKIVANFGILLFEKNFSMVRTNMDILIINYTHVVQYNGRV